jgi:hypothetical protein
MENEIRHLSNGDFEVLPLKGNQERYLQRLNSIRYQATQKGEHSLTLALDAEIEALIKRIG